MSQITIGRFLVVVQFMASGALVLSAKFDGGNWPSLIAAGVGLGVGVWSIAAIGARKVTLTPDVKPDMQLVTAGPYRLIRHPMYTALLFFAGGFVFMPFLWWKASAWLVLLFVLIAKSCIEERQLNAAFPAYAAYRSRSWRFVPYLW